MTARSARTCLSQILVTALMKGFSGLKQKQTAHPFAKLLVLVALLKQCSQQVLHNKFHQLISAIVSEPEITSKHCDFRIFK